LAGVAVTPAVLREYRRLRALRWSNPHGCLVGGWPASDALRAARIREAFDALEDEDLVRLRAVPDEDDWTCTEPDFDGQYARKCDADRAREEYEAAIEQDGLWILVAEYRLSEDDPWEHADACGGFLGDDLEDNGYDVDLRRSAVDAYHEARLRAASAAYALAPLPLDGEPAAGWAS
jgi:hypothetical protein